MGSNVRVAAAQCETGADVEANLATLQRLVAAAAAEGAELVVTPEFGNHGSVYESAAHAWDVAVDLGGWFVDGLAAAAREHGVWVAASATVRRDRAMARMTVTNLLLSPSDGLVFDTDKTVLMGSERDHLSAGNRSKAVVDTPFGPLGLYSCMEGVINEPARCLALDGALVLCNSLNSFALDEASLHIPVRAAENAVWVVAANKVGPLAPLDRIDALAASLDLAPSQLHGAGESQVVAPDGTVVAMAPRSGEAVVVADIDVGLARDKRTASGTDRFAVRRPELYGPIASQPTGRDDHSVAAELAVATVPGTGAALTVLPFGVAADITCLRPDQVVVTSRREGAAVVALAVDGGGRELLRQPMLHRSHQHPYATELGDGLCTVDLPWGRLALLCGEDHVQPESFRLAALASADVVAVTTGPLAVWERELGFRGRAAENRVTVVVGAEGGGVVAAPSTDFTLWTPWRRPFAGEINRPDLYDRPPGIVNVEPIAATNRHVSKGTDVVDGRPWRLLHALVT